MTIYSFIKKVNVDMKTKTIKKECKNIMRVWGRKLSQKVIIKCIYAFFYRKMFYVHPLKGWKRKKNRECDMIYMIYSWCDKKRGVE